MFQNNEFEMEQFPYRHPFDGWPATSPAANHCARVIPLTSPSPQQSPTQGLPRVVDAIRAAVRGPRERKPLAPLLRLEEWSQLPSLLRASTFSCGHH
ncbi:hypothetical protein DPEC_G00218940 [Dallia pectoralis]|uniref:Uncharacterized protein n=1 Tax=Dallia pectoralis TaxID=75939 RepID=A0ACC2G3A4_DALPE|nr:hypothetical protein DPEC_G00218940 [Dallia pectoralis]